MDLPKQFSEPVCALAIDAGGTCFKSGVVGSDGALIQGSQKTVVVDSQGTKEGILSAYKGIITHALELVDQLPYSLAGIGISTPGPFNIHTGQSLMKHKFRDLYEVDLAAAIRDISGLPKDFPIRFVHDSHAFLMGECWQGHGREFDRIAGITLGTGLGLGCSIDGRILTNEIGGPRISIFERKYGNGILEDRISKRGILAAYQKRKAGADPADLEVEEIARRGRCEEDSDALAVFGETGKILLDYLAPVCNELGIECVLFGGQISKSFDLIQPALGDACSRISTLQRIDRAARIEESPLLGAANIVFAGHKSNSRKLPRN